jgi:hypothetical protein
VESTKPERVCVSKSRHPEIRALLREHEDGMTVDELALILRVDMSNAVRTALKQMPDAYIDRWRKAALGPWTAVWCVVVPPENCPKPSDEQDDQLL